MSGIQFGKRTTRYEVGKFIPSLCTLIGKFRRNTKFRIHLWWRPRFLPTFLPFPKAKPANFGQFGAKTREIFAQPEGRKRGLGHVCISFLLSLSCATGSATIGLEIPNKFPRFWRAALWGLLISRRCSGPFRTTKSNPANHLWSNHLCLSQLYVRGQRQSPKSSVRCTGPRWPKMVKTATWGQDDLIANRILAFATKIDQTGPLWSILALKGLFGPFRSANRTLATPRFLELRERNCQAKTKRCGQNRFRSSQKSLSTWLTFSFLISEDFWVSSFFPAIAPSFYSPENVLKILRSLGKESKSQKSSLINKGKVKQGSEQLFGSSREGTKSDWTYFQQFSYIRTDFWEGKENSNFSVFRVRRFCEWPEPLH